ncbi:hypothetical protein CCP3SC5AM1_330017 [Gammaproteobacteria bacterium]
MYDGYQKYGVDEATRYEEERRKESIWWQEEAFIASYFAKNKPRIILDAPVGTGRFLERYIDAREVIGIDISEEMLKESLRKLVDPRLNSVKLMRGDIFKLDFPDNAFDLTICWRFTHLIPDNLLVNALRELGRVTNGDILLQTYVARPYWRRFIISLLSLPAKVYRRLSGNLPPLLPWGHIHAYFHTHETIAAKIAEAGLIINQRIEIGPYNDNIVYVYQITKPTTS